MQASMMLVRSTRSLAGRDSLYNSHLLVVGSYLLRTCSTMMKFWLKAEMVPASTSGSLTSCRIVNTRASPPSVLSAYLVRVTARSGMGEGEVS